MIRTVCFFVVLCALMVCAGCSDVDDPPETDDPGGHWVTEEIGCSWYLDNRFFRLDLPASWCGVPGEVLGYEHHDAPGRDHSSEHIDPNSIRVYRLLQDDMPQIGDVAHVATAVDSSGRWPAELVDAMPSEQWQLADLARPLEHRCLFTVDDDLVAIDLGLEQGAATVLAVTYDVIDDQGELLYEVGDQPEGGEEGGLVVDEQTYYRMKLLKPAVPDVFTFQYVLRNIYSLGGINIDATAFELTLETTDPTVEQPLLHDDTGYTYLNVFGLDIEDANGQNGADGLIDLHRPAMFDLERGLLKFPLDMPFPFAADEVIYRANAENAFVADGVNHTWAFEGTLLQDSLVPAIYDWRTPPPNYQHHNTFQFVIRTWRPR